MSRDTTRRRVLSLLLSMLLLVVYFGCGGSTTGNGSSDITLFLEQGICVSTYQAVQITFTQPCSLTTVNDSSLFLVDVNASSSSAAKGDYDPTICDAGQALPSEIDCEDDTHCSLAPNSRLDGESIYAVCLTDKIVYSNGATFPGATIIFETCNSSLPTVISTYPENGAKAVSWTTSIRATFSKEMDSTTIDEDTFRAILENSAIEGTLVYDASSKEVTFTPDAPLPFGAAVTVEISDSVNSIYGVPLEGGYSWGFDVTTQKAQDISVGMYHSCGINSSGTVKCWGGNNKGQLGDGTNDDSDVPVEVTGLAGLDVVAVDSGQWHSCALIADGTVKCWGYNTYGQLGDGTTTDSNVPVDVAGVSNVGAIAVAEGYNYALIDDGTIVMWGHNDLDAPDVLAYYPPVTIPGLTNVTAIAAEFYHSCAIIGDGTVKCWGMNRYGQFGDGTTDWSEVPVTSSGFSDTDAVDIATGAGHTCVLIEDGAMKCSGDNADAGELGDGTWIERHSPVDVVNMSTAVAISTGWDYTCTLLSSGGMQCWGENMHGELGDNSIVDKNVPTDVVGLSDVTAISAGGEWHANHTCALVEGGAAKCWGWNAFGQLGNNDPTHVDKLVPVDVVGF